MPEKLTLGFSGECTYYSLTKSLPLARTNIPEAFRNIRADIYWQVDVINHECSGKVHAKIINYDGRMQNFANQNIAAYDISEIYFDGFDLDKLIRSNAGNIPKEFSTRKSSSLIKAPITNLNYCDGYVSFTVSINNITTAISARNDYIRKEFEPISNCIAKLLGTKYATFNVEYIEAIDKQENIYAIQPLHVTSEEIDKIDSSLIEDATCAYSLDLIYGDTIENPHDLRTPDEFFNEIIGGDSNIKPEIFLQKALEFRGGKHRSQLKYLASKHLSSISKLHFTPRPFSFLFLIPGNKRYYFVLETFDEELATYIWQCENSADAVLNKIAEIKPLMSSFADKNRRAYSSSKPEGFYKFNHSYENELDGYNAWRDKLQETIMSAER